MWVFIMSKRPSKVRKHENYCDVRNCLQHVGQLDGGLYGDDEGTHQLCRKHSNQLEDGFKREAERVYQETQSVWDAQQGCFVKGRPKSGKYGTAVRDENGKWRASPRNISKIFDLKRE